MACCKQCKIFTRPIPSEEARAQDFWQAKKSAKSCRKDLERGSTVKGFYPSAGPSFIMPGMRQQVRRRRLHQWPVNGADLDAFDPRHPIRDTLSIFPECICSFHWHIHVRGGTAAHSFCHCIFHNASLKGSFQRIHATPPVPNPLLCLPAATVAWSKSIVPF